MPVWAGAGPTVRSHRWRLLAVAVAVVLLGAAAPAGGKTKPVAGLTITGPASRLVTGPSARVVVETPRGVTSFRAIARGNVITGRFRRVSATRRAATVAVGSDVRAGVNRVTVTARVRGGAIRAGTLRLIVARKGRRAGGARVDRRGSQYVARLRLAGSPALLRATLNGRPATRLFGRPGRGLTEAVMAPHDGLRFGRNTLRITAALADGSALRRTIRFRIKRGLPLASAGRDRRARVRDTVRFDARKSLPGKGKLLYRWRIADRPKRSKATLARATGARPRLRPDRNGTYRVVLTVRRRGSARRATDSVTTTAIPSYPSIGGAIDTAARAPGGGRAITIGGNCTAVQQGCTKTTLPYGNSSVQLVFLARDTLEVQSVTRLGTGAAGALQALAAVASRGEQESPVNSIGILASLPGAATSQRFAPAIQVLTGLTPTLNPAGGWSAIGIPVTNGNRANKITGVVNAGDSPTDGAHVQGSMRGWMQFNDRELVHRFVPGRFSSYDTSTPASTATANTIRVGAQTYASNALGTGCTGGYQLVTVRAGTLGAPTAAPANQTFPTNCADDGTSLLGVLQLGSALNAITGAGPAGPDGPLTVFLQSIGDPISGSQQVISQTAPIAAFVDQLGGTGETFNRTVMAANSGYALAGGTALRADAAQRAGPATAPEATSLQKGSGVTLDGVLKGNLLWHFQPVNGASNFGGVGALTDITYQPPTPWPTGAAPGEANALAYLSKRFGIEYSPASSCYKPVRPDVRFEYCDGNLTKLQGLLTFLSQDTVPYARACGCSRAQWAAVTSGLENEITWVIEVNTYVGLVQTIYGGPSTDTTLIDLEAIGSQVAGAVNPPAGSGLTGEWLSLEADVTNALSLFPEQEGAETALSAVSAVSYLAADILGYPDGTYALGQIVNTEAAALPGQLSARYQAASDQLDHFGAILVGDYGKLRAAGSGTLLQIDSTTLEEAQGELMAGAFRFAYRQLLGAAYDAYAILPSTNTPNVTAPNQVGCFQQVPQAPSFYYPYANAPAGTWITQSPNDPALAIYDNASPWFLLLGEKGGSGASSITSPPASLITPLSRPIVFNGAGVPQTFGEYAPWLYRQAFKQVVPACRQQ